MIMVASLFVATTAFATTPWNGNFSATSPSGVTCNFWGHHDYGSGVYHASTGYNSGSCSKFYVRVKTDNGTPQTWSDPYVASVQGTYSYFNYSQHGAVPSLSTNVYWGGLEP